MLLQAFIRFQKIWVAHCSVVDIFKCDEPTVYRNKKKNSWHLMTMFKMLEHTLKLHHECYQLLTLNYPMPYYSLKNRFQELSEAVTYSTRTERICAITGNACCLHNMYIYVRNGLAFRFIWWFIGWNVLPILVVYIANKTVSAVHGSAFGGKSGPSVDRDFISVVQNVSKYMKMYCHIELSSVHHRKMKETFFKPSCQPFVP
jgi:hypothetical protein